MPYSSANLADRNADEIRHQVVFFISSVSIKKESSLKFCLHCHRLGWPSGQSPPREREALCWVWDLAESFTRFLHFSFRYTSTSQDLHSPISSIEWYEQDDQAFALAHVRLSLPTDLFNLPVFPKTVYSVPSMCQPEHYQITFSSTKHRKARCTSRVEMYFFVITMKINRKCRRAVYRKAWQNDAALK